MEVLPRRHPQLRRGRAHRLGVETGEGVDEFEGEDEQARLLGAQPHGHGDLLGVGDEDLPAVPGRVDEVIGHVPGTTGDEEELEVVDEGGRIDAEVRGGLLEVGTGVGVEVGDEAEQPGEAFTR